MNKLNQPAQTAGSESWGPGKTYEVVKSAQPAQQEPIAAPQYTCIGKGGTYERLGIATGAGTSKTKDPVVVYKDVATGRLFFRAESDFDARMERLS